MGLLWALIVGLVVGALAKLIMPGRDGGGMLVTALLGVVGAMLAFAIGRVFGMYGNHDEAPGLIASVLGAVLVLVVYRSATGRRRRLI